MQLLFHQHNNLYSYPTQKYTYFCTFNLHGCLSLFLTLGFVSVWTGTYMPVGGCCCMCVHIQMEGREQFQCVLCLFVFNQPAESWCILLCTLIKEDHRAWSNQRLECSKILTFLSSVFSLPLQISTILHRWTAVSCCLVLVLTIKFNFPPNVWH